MEPQLRQLGLDTTLKKGNMCFGLKFSRNLFYLLMLPWKGWFAQLMQACAYT